MRLYIIIYWTEQAATFEIEHQGVNLMQKGGSISLSLLLERPYIRFSLIESIADDDDDNINRNRMETGPIN